MSALETSVSRKLSSSPWLLPGPGHSLLLIRGPRCPLTNQRDRHWEVASWALGNWSCCSIRGGRKGRVENPQTHSLHPSWMPHNTGRHLSALHFTLRSPGSPETHHSTDRVCAQQHLSPGPTRCQNRWTPGSLYLNSELAGGLCVDMSMRTVTEMVTC